MATAPGHRSATTIWLPAWPPLGLRPATKRWQSGGLIVVAGGYSHRWVAGRQQVVANSLVYRIIPLYVLTNTLSHTEAMITTWKRREIWPMFMQG